MGTPPVMAALEPDGDGETVTVCQLCGWSFPVFMGEPEVEVLWKGAAVLHGWLRHPKEQAHVTGHHPEERLALYRREMGDEIYETLVAFALDDPETTR